MKKNQKKIVQEVDALFSYSFKKFKEGVYNIHPLNFEVIDDRQYYVYRISNKLDNIHYYGSRVCTGSAYDDLGKKYFSSSKAVKQAIKDLGITNFKFKVVKVFNNNSDKILYESFLHQIFDVKNNNCFYNKANQTFKGFDTTNNYEIRLKIQEYRVGTKLSDTTKNKIRASMLQYNRVGEYNPFYGKSHTKEYRDTLSKRLKGNSGLFLNKKHSINSKQKMSEVKLGELNSSWLGYYIYQKNKYVTANDMKLKLGINGNVCRRLDEIITSRHYGKSKFLQDRYSKRIIGKTWKDLSFDFIDKKDIL